MTALFAALFGSSALLGLWFALAFGPPWRSSDPPMAWLQAMLAWAAVAFDVMFLLALFHVHVPAWVYVAILLAQDAVFAWRLVVLYRTRRRPLIEEEVGR